VLGAVLHPLVFLLSLFPGDVRGLDAVLSNAKSIIADLLAWGLVSLFLIMMGFVVAGRSTIRSRASAVPIRLPSQNRPPSVVVAITAYNDAEATARAVRRFKAQDHVIEVLAIDNNSTDRTAELAMAAGARVIRESRQGYGYACIRGLQEAASVPDADVVVLTEGDGTFVADDLSKFLAYIDQADMVVGTRVVRALVEDGSQMDYFFTWGNLAVAALLRLRFWNAQFLGAARLTDVGCTYRAIRRDALERILPDLEVGGNHFSPHMMLIGLTRGLSLIEIPVTFRRRDGRSKGASQSLFKGLQVGLAMIWHILTYRVKPESESIRTIPQPAVDGVFEALEATIIMPEAAREGAFEAGKP
jgi:cellulose synthase/poly-beta-1,6-N-acetylglucosamine synthase-like glycosyltransferase